MLPTKRRLLAVKQLPEGLSLSDGIRQALRLLPRAEPAGEGTSTQGRRRGVYLLPSLFTMGNMFCGYACVVHAMRGELATAAPFIGVAVVLDMLDGRIARMTGTSSEFGLQLDSLADLVSFGMAPAILAFQWGLAPLGRMGWAVGFVFLTWLFWKQLSRWQRAVHLTAGVWLLAGGSHNSLAVEMKDHAVVIEGPLYDARSQAVISEQTAAVGDGVVVLRMLLRGGEGEELCEHRRPYRLHVGALLSDWRDQKA